MLGCGLLVRAGARGLAHERLFGRFGATVAIGLTIFVLSVVTVIICFTCSCCYLYKMCRRPPRRKHARPLPAPRDPGGVGAEPKCGGGC